ncbi:MAG TPA: hypothetical protein P5104_03005 [Bacteroidales bacterium]|nr:hypothetical protein [Bacteroidales bacterium]
METYKRIPVFFGLRIYAMSSMLYLLLVLPFAGFLVLQNLPALIERSEGIINQVKSEENTPSPTQEIITKPADDKNLFKVIQFSSKSGCMGDTPRNYCS